MKDKKIVIVEDEVIVAKDIARCIEKIGYSVANIFHKGEKLLEFLNIDSDIDLILMDIMLSDKVSGIELAEKVKEKYNIPVIFLTAYADSKTINKAKVVEPYGYIIKPFKEIDLKINIEMALYKTSQEKNISQSSPTTTSSNSEKFIYVRANSKLVKIKNDDIYFIEALKDYVIVHTIDEKYTVHSTMKDMVKKLNEEMFFRVHRSYIVNLNKIESIKRNDIFLECFEKEIPIGGSYRKKLFTKLNFA